MQVSDAKLYMIARGFTALDAMEERIVKILEEMNNA